MTEPASRDDVAEKPEPSKTIYVWWSDDGKYIRQWQTWPFKEGLAYSLSEQQQRNWEQEKSAPRPPQGALLGPWFPIDTAPKTGEHILLGKFDGGTGFGICGGRHQPIQVVAHWFEYGVPGFYASTYGTDQADPFIGFTHWQSLSERPDLP